LIPALVSVAAQPSFMITAPNITALTTNASGIAGTSTVVPQGGVAPITYSIARIGGSTNIFNATAGTGGSTNINYSLPSVGVYTTTFRWTGTDNNGIVATTDFTVTVSYFTVS